MKLKNSFFYTLRENVKDEDSTSGNLLVRSGMVKKSSSGVYMYMPMGYRVLKKIENIIREEMDKTGAQELLMPSLIPEDVYIQVKGKVVGIETIGAGPKARLSAKFVDETGMVELVFFKGLKWIKETLHFNKEYVIFGKPSLFKNTYNFAHPDFEPIEVFMVQQAQQTEKFSPLYNTSEKMKNSFLNSKAISKLTRTLLSQTRGYIHENLPPYIIERFKLISHEDALIQIHFPSSPELLAKAKARLKFEELFYMQLEHQLMKNFRT